jgi:predicted SAM-dependent methyltransferase
MLKLDLGCGNEKQKRKGFFGIDINLRYRPDLVVDCDKGLPFKDGVADEINMDNSLEHFHNPFSSCRKATGSCEREARSESWCPTSSSSLF